MSPSPSPSPSPSRSPPRSPQRQQPQPPGHENYGSQPSRSPTRSDKMDVIYCSQQQQDEQQYDPGNGRELSYSPVDPAPVPPPQRQQVYRPTSLAYSPSGPAFNPTSAAYQPTSPTNQPNSPVAPVDSDDDKPGPSTKRHKP
ncbi:hypothetical protein N2152v2_007824 [Parachlorella kessleri]